MTREDYNKYNENMKIIYDIECRKKLVKVFGHDVIEIFDCFGHCNENNDIVFDVEVKTKYSYLHLRNVPLEKLQFEY